MDNDSKILVAGANGMVGSAIVRNLRKKGYFNIIEATRNRVDFTDQEETKEFFEKNKESLVEFYKNQNGIGEEKISEVIYDYKK